jgi:hypothetical protein
VLVAATLVAALLLDAAVALLINPGAAAPRVALLLAGRHRRAGVAASAFLTVVTARTALAGPGGAPLAAVGALGLGPTPAARALVAPGPPC